MSDSPLARAQAAGYTLGPWTTDGAHAATEVRCWLRDGERAGFMPAACVFVGSSERAAFWQAREPTDFPDCPRIVEERIPDADLATLRARADAWLGVRREADGAADDATRAAIERHVADLGAVKLVPATEVDRLAAEVGRLRAGIGEAVSMIGEPIAYEAWYPIEIEAINLLRSLLAPTPAAPDDR